MKKYFSLVFCLLIISGNLFAQQLSTPKEARINPHLLHGRWSARWITCPDAAPRAYGVYHFRKPFSLKNKPGHFIIHVTADNRYHLFVNGKPVGRGPARGNLYDWNFGTYDIAPFLHNGENVIAALVWNMGVYAPVAQVSNRTGFLVQGDEEKEEIVNTNSSWKVFHDTAYTPCATNMGVVLHSYFVVGPGDEVQAKNYPWGWEKLSYDDSSWPNAKVIGTSAVPVGYGTDNLWTLTPRTIPQMEETLQRLSSVRHTDGINTDGAFLKGDHPLTIPANSHVTLLLDQSFETTAYPILKVNKGEDAKIKLTYAEALFDSAGEKGNRDVIKGKKIIGFYDIFYPDGGEGRIFSPLWFRTYRYLQMDIQTKDEPLVIEDFYGMYTGYPFEHKATFSSNDTSLKQIWKTGWRTARLCAGETYYDCPYYEQLQYEADTRIQALISLYNAGDDRLMRKAIHDFYNSRVPVGLTQGRYPSNRLQVIPPFSLFWVSMLYDYWMLRPDTNFVKQYLDAATLVLKWYEQHIDPSKGMLGPMDWWSFVDWNDAFPRGVPDGATDGNSSVITLQYAYTLQQAAKLFGGFGRKEEAAHYAQLAKTLAHHTYQYCFDHQKMEMANQPTLKLRSPAAKAFGDGSQAGTPKKEAFSQHASIMAILANAIPEDEQKQVMKNILYDSTLSQATFYYRFYLTRAMVKAGLGDLYYSQLTPWRNMLKIGLTTFAEKPDPTRSDCHGWSASPNYDFLATICGIMPAAPGFKEVKIEPHLGELKEVQASMPHFEGTIKISLKRNEENGIHAEITLPGSLTGEFIWQGKTVELRPGKQVIDL